VRRLIPLAVFSLLAVNALGDHYFRDEFYYLACARRLAWGYVDHPPLSILILWLLRHVAGDSLFALRLTAALAAAANVALAGSMARRMGASRIGVTLAMTATAVAPMLLSLGSFYSMNVFDVLAWSVAMRLFMDVLERPSTARWLLLGVALGLGLENKLSVLWLGAGIGAGLLLTPARRQLLTIGPWLAGAIAAAIIAPHVLWQVAHGWPTLEFIRNASRDKMQAVTPIRFLADQVMNMNPFTMPVWLTGLVVLLVSRHAARWRPLGVAFLTVAAILILNGTSRSGYLAPAYTMLFAAGGAAIERVVAQRVARGAMLTVLVAGGLVSVPLAIPVLSTDRYVAYSRALGIAPSTEERKDVGRLPQFFADREGWDQFVGQVAAVFERLSPAERASAAVLVGNYGEAGAIEQLGRGRGLTAISGHNNYWLWGPAGRTGDVLIVVSRSAERLEEQFSSVEPAGQIACGDCMPYENGQTIFICRNLKPPALAARWPGLKHYD
jgi:hypothetical protein